MWRKVRGKKRVKQATVWRWSDLLIMSLPILSLLRFQWKTYLCKYPPSRPLPPPEHFSHSMNIRIEWVNVQHFLRVSFFSSTKYSRSWYKDINSCTTFSLLLPLFFRFFSCSLFMSCPFSFANFYSQCWHFFHGVISQLFFSLLSSLSPPANLTQRMNFVVLCFWKSLILFKQQWKHRHCELDECACAGGGRWRTTIFATDWRLLLLRGGEEGEE